VRSLFTFNKTLGAWLISLFGHNKIYLWTLRERHKYDIKYEYQEWHLIFWSRIWMKRISYKWWCMFHCLLFFPQLNNKYLPKKLWMIIFIFLHCFCRLKNQSRSDIYKALSCHMLIVFPFITIHCIFQLIMFKNAIHCSDFTLKFGNMTLEIRIVQIMDS